MDEIAPLTDSLTFGIGCYSFEAPDADLLLMQNPDGSYSIHDWARDVEQALRSIPSLDNIVVTGFRTVRGDSPSTWRNFGDGSKHFSDEKGLHRGGDLRPHPVGGRIQFDVRIPLHVQENVFSWGTALQGTKFEVDIRYGQGMPVAFVRAADVETHPSMAVAVVREFLRSEFDARLAANPITFTIMGPSPMWNDCFLRWTQDQQERFVEVQVEKTPGYGQVTFLVKRSSQGRTLEDAYDRLKDGLEEELNLYYEMVSRNAVLHVRRSHVEYELGELVANHQSSGLGAWLWRRFKGERNTNNLLLEILALDSEHKRALGNVRGEWEEIRNRSLAHAFDAAFEREFEKPDFDHTENAKSVALLLSERLSRETQVLVVIVSSLLGGVIGAALTALVQVGG